MNTCKQKYRIYQMDIENAEAGLAFMDYDFLKARGYERPPAEYYRLVYESEIEVKGPGNLLEKLFRIFNLEHPEDYSARSMSVSDIVEFYGNGKREFFFCDSIGFQMVDFDTDKALPMIE